MAWSLTIVSVINLICILRGFRTPYLKNNSLLVRLKCDCSFFCCGSTNSHDISSHPSYLSIKPYRHLKVLLWKHHLRLLGSFDYRRIDQTEYDRCNLHLGCRKQKYMDYEIIWGEIVFEQHIQEFCTFVMFCICLQLMNSWFFLCSFSTRMKCTDHLYLILKKTYCDRNSSRFPFVNEILYHLKVPNWL